MATSVDGVELREEDRLPWLETVDAEDGRGPSVGRVVALVLLGLAVLAAIIFGVYKAQRHTPAAAGGELIAAQEGDYKIRPADPGGLHVNGEGAAAVATSAGRPHTGAIDLNAVPEAPVNGRRAAQPLPTAQAGGRNAVVAVPASGGRLVAPPPVTAAHGPAPGSASGGSLVQLGAYPSEAIANSAWTAFSHRFAYLAPLGKSIQPVATGGRTLYRLRVNAGGANQAADICGRLKVAGEGCFVAS
ncbi:SPOR domain-containing protein [Sphingomonas sp.]|uniref:SPOR domain-containing protein n=1 Tax=Sphingomonas sp. TaxID=28214 RepID=UPI003CC646AA